MIESPSATQLDGIQILIVEDNFAVADGLKILLESHGGNIVGMAGSVDKALGLVESTPFSVAILDILLRYENVTPVAERILEKGIPFLYITGYEGLEMLPPELQHAPLLEKPVDPDQLLPMIRALARGQ